MDIGVEGMFVDLGRPIQPLSAKHEEGEEMNARVPVEDEERGEEHVMREFVPLTCESCSRKQLSAH